MIKAALILLFIFSNPASSKEITGEKEMIFCWCPPSKTQPGFWIAKFEATVAQVRGKQSQLLPDETKQKSTSPIVMADHKTIRRFLKEMNERGQKSDKLLDGWEYDLPTEAEWQYACLAGSTPPKTPTDLAKHANFADKTLWDSQVQGDFHYAEKSVTDGYAFLAPVGSFTPNAWGIHDMQGNVWEMTLTKKSPKDKGSFVLCGGSWCSPADQCQPHSRRPSHDREKSRFSGFRLVMRKIKS